MSEGLPIDASGSLSDGTKFEGLDGLRKTLLSRREQFVSTFTSKLVTYGLGREVVYYDLPAIRKIVRDAVASDYRWSSIILGVVKSTPFQMSIVQRAAPQVTAANGAENQKGARK
jgi:hypothetical protein